VKPGRGFDRFVGKSVRQEGVEEGVMKTFDLLEDLDIGEQGQARAVFADHEGRALRFALSEGEEIKQFHAHSPTYIVVLKGQGLFRGADGEEKKAGPNTMVIFDNGEDHAVRAIGGDLVFVSVLHGAPQADADHEAVSTI
jgi:quercetin dioxygenase-like cupin family protein